MVALFTLVACFMHLDLPRLYSGLSQPGGCLALAHLCRFWPVVLIKFEFVRAVVGMDALLATCVKLICNHSQ